MRIRTLLNNCHHLKFFVYKSEQFETISGKASLVIEIEPRKNGKPMWASRLSWQEVTRSFQTSWTHVYRSVKSVVEYGLAERELTNIKAIGVDEIQFGKGRQYLTLVYQLEAVKKRLLHIAPRRTVKNFLSFFRLLGNEKSQSIKYVCSDM